MDDDEFIDTGPLCVYERTQGEERIDTGFSAATILLDAQASASLDWSKELSLAQEFIKQGKQLLFDFEFGLFDAKAKPLAHHGQFQAASFAISHFREEYWPTFAPHTIGALLCRSTHEDIFPIIDYMELLAGELPSSCQPFLLFDATCVTDAYTFISLFRQDQLSRFQVGIKNAPSYTSFTVWQQGRGSGGYIGTSPMYVEEHLPTIGILIPPANEPIPLQIQEVLSENPKCKSIPEPMLTGEWDGLEHIIVPYTVTSVTTKRALDGFLAAGGTLSY